MEHIWLKSYPKGIPADINPDAYPSLCALFEESTQKFGKLPAFNNMGTQLSYHTIYQRAKAFAAYLQQRLGVVKGTRVALMMPNLLQYPIAMFGAMLAGAIVVNVNPLYTARELKHQLNDSGAEIIVIVSNFAHVLSDVIDETSIREVILTNIGDEFPLIKRDMVNSVVRYIKKMIPSFHLKTYVNWLDAINQGMTLTLIPVSLTGEDTAYLQYTGGTTGVAKGAVLSHRNMIANILQATAWMNGSIDEAKEVIITALPLYHVFCLTANCLVFFRMGAENILITNPRDMSGFIKTLAKLPRFTLMTGVNTLFNGMLHHPAFSQLNFSHFKFALGGGAAVQKAVADQWKAVTGKPLIEAYGLTETSPAVCINPVTLTDYNGSIGLPLPSTEVSIRDEHGQELPLGEVGELCVKGPQVIHEYWQKPEETRACFFEPGVLRTGDMAVMDENGYVFLKERKKDMILVSGFNVYPTEIEDILVRHPDVLEAAVVSVPSEDTGEAVKAFIVKKNPKLTAEDIIQYARTQLTAYKVPKQIEFREELPKSNVGKILRRELR